MFARIAGSQNAYDSNSTNPAFETEDGGTLTNGMETVTAKDTCSIVLPIAPGSGQRHRIMADGGTVTLSSTAHPLVGGPYQILSGGSMDVTFDAAGRWIVNAAGTVAPITVLTSDVYVGGPDASDTHDGLTPQTAVATMSKVASLLGTFSTPPATPRQIAVHLLSNPPDPLRLLSAQLDESSIAFLGEGIVITEEGALDVVTDGDPTTNQAWAITCNAVDFTGLEQARIRITSGPSNGAIAYVTSVVSAHVVTTTPFATPDLSDLGSPTVIPTTPTAGDSFVVEELTVLGTDTFLVAGGTVLFQDLDVASTVLNLSGDCAIVFASSRITGAGASAITSTESYFMASFFLDNGTEPHFAGLNFFYAGGSLIDLEFDAGGGQARFDADFTCHGCHPEGFNGYTVFISGLAVFNSPEHGLDTHPQASFAFEPGAINNPPTFWGKGNDNAGLDVQAGSTFLHTEGDIPTITGGAADAVNFRLAFSTTGYAFDNSTQAYTTARSCSWSNLAAAIGSGGFAENAHYPEKNAHIVSFGTGP